MGNGFLSTLRIPAYWGRVGAVLSQGRTADGGPELAESRAAVHTLPQMLTALYTVGSRYPDQIPLGEVPKHGEAYGQTLAHAES